MRERPILFNTEMVKAILGGEKDLYKTGMQRCKCVYGTGHGILQCR